jgi:hypothetical protein
MHFLTKRNLFCMLHTEMIIIKKHHIYTAAQKSTFFLRQTVCTSWLVYERRVSTIN